MATMVLSDDFRTNSATAALCALHASSLPWLSKSDGHTTTGHHDGQHLRPLGRVSWRNQHGSMGFEQINDHEL